MEKDTYEGTITTGLSTTERSPIASLFFGERKSVAKDAVG